MQLLNNENVTTMKDLIDFLNSGGLNSGMILLVILLAGVAYRKGKKLLHNGIDYYSTLQDKRQEGKDKKVKEFYEKVLIEISGLKQSISSEFKKVHSILDQHESDIQNLKGK